MVWPSFCRNDDVGRQRHAIARRTNLQGTRRDVRHCIHLRMKFALCSLLFAGASVAAADPAATAINELGVDLHQRLAAAKPNANLCVSAYSIQSALAMT